MQRSMVVTATTINVGDSKRLELPVQITQKQTQSEKSAVIVLHSESCQLFTPYRRLLLFLSSAFSPFHVRFHTIIPKLFYLPALALSLPYCRPSCHKQTNLPGEREKIQFFTHFSPRTFFQEIACAYNLREKRQCTSY